MRRSTIALVCSVGLAAYIAEPVIAQTALNTAFPAPAAGEQGPVAGIASTVPLADMVTAVDPQYQHTDGEGQPDVLGAFRFICTPGHNNGDDAIVAPGVKGGAPHSHSYTGLLGVNYTFGSFASQRQSTNKSTCGGQGNKTAYWFPDLLSKPGTALRLAFSSIYYKGFPHKGQLISPYCDANSPMFGGECVTVPNDLRMIFGYDFLTGTSPTGAVGFKCVTADQSTNRTDFLASMTTALASCQAGDFFVAKIDAPSCWDGKRIDSSNHRGHVGYIENSKCPLNSDGTRWKQIPHFTQQNFYKLPANFSGLRFSCDMPGMAPGTCYHQDYKEGWDNKIKKAWFENCIGRLLNCAGGDLGNGYALKPDEIVTYVANPPTAKQALIRGGTARGMVHVGHH